jgi:hypothetical protein
MNFPAIAPLGNVPDLTLCSKAMLAIKCARLKPKTLLRFASEQTRFALGQVSVFQTG